MRHAQLLLLSVVDERHGRFLPGCHIADIWTKLRIVGKTDWCAVEHRGSIGDREFATVGRNPNHLYREFAIEHGRPDGELVFCGHRNSFLLVVEICAMRRITVSVTMLTEGLMGNCFEMGSQNSDENRRRRTIHLTLRKCGQAVM